MGIILNLQELDKVKNHVNQKLVLAGGCFDILHTGHIEFLKKAKERGDILVVILEGDQKIKELKGNNRPINTQEDRATILSNLSMVDYVIPLPYMENDQSYEALVKMIQPDIIALTAGAPIFEWEKRYVKAQNAKIVEVIKPIKDYSTTNIINKARI
ncbi:MAG TPA: adenylyltransferase/cytidyltransferase family protein [Patescibacteria group bacterium]|nr:adenylyltransferase/cytidyltransferase family protein [Patescibacteria group bacterium]